MIEANFSGLLPLLANAGVDFILIGGGAGVVHGLARATYDVDVVYSRDTDNLRALVAALKDYKPYLRGVPEGLPFRWTVETLENGLNFTLTTSIGNLDLLGEVAGGGTFEQLIPDTERVHLYGIECKVVSLKKLIQLKRAAGRPKDLEVIAELEALSDEQRGT